MFYNHFVLRCCKDNKLFKIKSNYETKLVKYLYMTSNLTFDIGQKSDVQSSSAEDHCESNGATDERTGSGMRTETTPCMNDIGRRLPLYI